MALWDAWCSTQFVPKNLQVIQRQSFLPLMKKWWSVLLFLHLSYCSFLDAFIVGRKSTGDMIAAMFMTHEV